MHAISTSAPRSRGAPTVERAGLWVPKRSAYTSFIAWKSLRSARNTVVFVTRSSDDSAETRTAARLSRTRRVWARMSSPPTSCPVSGSSASCPAQNTKSPEMIAWLYGPTGAGARSVFVLRRSIYSPFCERADDSARENLIILRQDAPQVERDPLLDDPRDDRRFRRPESLSGLCRGPSANRDGERRLRLLRQRAAADGRAYLHALGWHSRRDELRGDRSRADRESSRRRRDHSPNRELLLGSALAVRFKGREKSGDRQLVGPKRAHERVRPELGDLLRASHGDARLRPAQKLVAAEGDDVRTLTHGLGDRQLLAEAEAGRVQKRAAAEIVDEGDVVFARER